jgi:nucleotide-binding universal stress UspA family protein
MFKTIVVGTDGSETAERAVDRAAEIAAATEGRVHLVSAYASRPVRVAGGAEAEAGDWAIGGDFNADAVLQRTLERLRTQGIDVQDHAPKGDPADGIIEVATRENADLIVIGSVGMQGARRILGSVPNKVSHHAPCDVLIVHTA